MAITTIQFQTFASPQKETMSIICPRNLPSISTDFLLLDISCQWNHIICNLLCLAWSLSIMVLRFIHMVSRINSSFFFMPELSNTPFYEGYLFSMMPIAHLFIHLSLHGLISWSAEPTGSGRNLACTTFIEKANASLQDHLSGVADQIASQEGISISFWFHSLIFFSHQHYPKCDFYNG